MSRVWRVAVACAVVLLGACQLIPTGSPPAPGGSHTRTTVNHEGTTLHVLTPVESIAAPAAGRPVMVWVHGGGWFSGTGATVNTEIVGVPGHYDGAMAAHQILRGWIVVALDYDLVAHPSTPVLEEELADVDAAVRWAAEQPSADPSRIVVAGHSAGGHLATLYGLTTEREVAAVVNVDGPTDLTAMAAVEQGSIDPAAAGTEDVYGPTAEIGELPRALVGCMAAGVAAPCDDRLTASSPISHISAGDPPIYLVCAGTLVAPFPDYCADHQAFAAAVTESGGVATRQTVALGNHITIEHQMNVLSVELWLDAHTPTA